MTTIILGASHAMIAGDGLISDDSGIKAIEGAVKVFNVCGVLFGAAGDVSKCQQAKALVADMLSGATDPEEAVAAMAKVTGPDGADYIVSFPCGAAFAVESGVYLVIPEGEHYAIGSGKAFALGAMAMGGSCGVDDMPEGDLITLSIVAASDVDTNTNDQVTVVGFGDEE